MAKARRVSIERYVEQVVDGNHYKGYIKIDDAVLDYEMVFAVPITQLDEVRPFSGQDDVRRVFQLTLRRGDADIELTNDEYGFFFQLLARFVIGFHNNPQTRGSNVGFFGEALRGEGPLSGLGGSASIGMRSKTSYDFPPELCEMLNAPKFGCSLVVS